MLFNSYEFLFIFLPITAIGFFGLTRLRMLRLATYWLTLTSLAFYAYWNPPYVILLLVSVIGNYLIGAYLNRTDPGPLMPRVMMWLGVVFNLGILGYYKYANFFITSVNQTMGSSWAAPDILLPLGISFYSFTQIAYVVDAYRSDRHSLNYNFVDYTLFVVFFPQLIAGPILRHDDLIPKLRQTRHFIFSHKNVALGCVTFILGLGKKMLIADTLSPVVAQAFQNATDLSFIDAWIGSLSYTFQLYFDFSGYSDMAIGLGLIFNLALPINFNSPYKALSVGDFWRRWHITLSHFLRDYLYIPLGGSRRGDLRRYGNLILTMLLGGLWHGAGWTFVVWGGLQGLFLAIDHGWRKTAIALPKIVAWSLTFLAIIFSWVVFRAGSIADAWAIAQTMVGAHGFSLSSQLPGMLPGIISYNLPMAPRSQSVGLLLLLLSVVVVCPNTQEWVSRFRPNRLWAISMGIIAAWCLLSLNRVSEFLYFQF
ncbi:MAG: MBOAT family protein [Merismopedia sp. SIO2A8]|nr:MBOAT family protein [Merismopedia sp. SIO2A8]